MIKKLFLITVIVFSLAGAAGASYMTLKIIGAVGGVAAAPSVPGANKVTVDGNAYTVEGNFVLFP